MSSAGGSPDTATEKQLVLLLSQPLEQYGVVTTLALDSFTLVLALLRPPTQKVRSPAAPQPLCRPDLVPCWLWTPLPSCSPCCGPPPVDADPYSPRQTGAS